MSSALSLDSRHNQPGRLIKVQSPESQELALNRGMVGAKLFKEKPQTRQNASDCR
jgi:hypothetical protein